MKAGWLFVVLFVFLISCRHKNESLQPVADTSQTFADTIQPGRKLAFRECNALVVGEGVRLRSAPDITSEVVEKLNTGALLRIIRSGDSKVLLGPHDPCNPDGFSWCEVIGSGGERGWIYGEFIFRLVIKGRNDSLLDNLQLKLFKRHYKFNEQWYRMGFATALRSAVFPKGDTACVRYLIPFMYLEQEGIAYPLKFFPNKKNIVNMATLTKEQGYFQFTRGGLHDDSLDAYRMLDDELQLTLARQSDPEEDPFRYTLVMKPATGFFSVIPTDPGREYLPSKQKKQPQ